MSDECLMKQETAFSFYTQYQAVMRKFTLAGKSVQIRITDTILFPFYIFYPFPDAIASIA